MKSIKKPQNDIDVDMLVSAVAEFFRGFGYKAEHPNVTDGNRNIDIDFADEKPVGQTAFFIEEINCQARIWKTVDDKECPTGGIDDCDMRVTYDHPEGGGNGKTLRYVVAVHRNAGSDEIKKYSFILWQEWMAFLQSNK